MEDMLQITNRINLLQIQKVIKSENVEEQCLFEPQEKHALTYSVLVVTFSHWHVTNNKKKNKQKKSLHS